jgi:tetratricopeptide (TPR) repeat protein
VEPLNNLGLVYAAQGLWDQALRTYQAALQSHPDVAEVWFNLGLAQRDAGSTQEAFQSLQRALQLDPGIPQRLGPAGR